MADLSPAALLREAARPGALLRSWLAVFLLALVALCVWVNFGHIALAYAAPPLAAMAVWRGALGFLAPLSARERREELALTGLRPEGYLLPLAVSRIAQPFLQAVACIVLAYLCWLPWGIEVVNVMLFLHPWTDPGFLAIPVALRAPAMLGNAVVLSIATTLAMAAQSALLTAAGFCNVLVLMCRRRNAGRWAIMEFAPMTILWGAVGVFGPLGAFLFFLNVCQSGTPAAVGEFAPIEGLMPAFIGLSLAGEAAFLGWSWRRLCGIFYRFED